MAVDGQAEIQDLDVVDPAPPREYLGEVKSSKAGQSRQGCTSIDEYIKRFPTDVQAKLEAIRQAIRRAAPDAEERISYKMPCFHLNGNLVYFAGYNNHVGFYPTASGIAKFKDAISMYKNSKGAVQFPIQAEMPIKLVERIVRFRALENRKRARIKK